MCIFAYNRSVLHKPWIYCHFVDFVRHMHEKLLIIVVVTVEVLVLEKVAGSITRASKKVQKR